MSWSGKRQKSVRKTVTFTNEEWSEVEQIVSQIRTGNISNWNDFARKAIMCKPIYQIVLPVDPERTTAEISKIGNNVNQIARKVNTQDYASIEEVKNVRLELEKINSFLDQCWKLYREAKN